MSFTQASNLRPQENVDQTVRIVGWRVSFTVVRCVNSRERIPVRKDLVEPGGSKVLANMLHRIRERFGDTARRSRGSQKIRAVGHQPQSQEWRDTCNGAGPRQGIGHEREVAQPQILPEAFVISEQEGLVFPQGPAQRSAEDIALKLRDGAVVEEVPGVQGAVPQKIVEVTVELVCAGGGHDGDLRSGTLSIFGAAGIRNAGHL